MDILTLTTYKEYQGINSDTKDTQIAKSIKAVNDTIPSYCNRTFVDYYSTDKVEYFDATLPDYFPKEFPILSVTSLEYAPLNDGTYDTELDLYTDYIIDDENSRIVSIRDQFIYTNVPTNSGKLTYKGGYEEFPEDLVQAAVMLVEYYMEDAYTPRKSLAGASTDNVIIPDKTARMPVHVRRILEHYRAWDL